MLLYGKSHYPDFSHSDSARDDEFCVARATIFSTLFFKVSQFSNEKMHEIYAWIVRNGRLPDPRELEDLDVEGDQFQACLSLLEQVGLIRVSSSDHVIAVSPDLAEVEFLAPAQKAMGDIQCDIEEIRGHFAHMRTSYFQARRERNDAEKIDTIVGKDDLTKMLKFFAGRAEREVTINESLSDAENCDMEDDYIDKILAGRGVHARRIMPHSSLAGPTAQHRIRRISEVGTEIRTIPEALDQVVVFDNEVAVLTEGELSTVIREPRIVAYLRRSLNNHWITARPYESTDAGYSDAFEEIKLMILRLLANGLKDETVAKRVNLSVRTCRRHIAEAMAAMGATSRFQAGVIATNAGLLRSADISRAKPSLSISSQSSSKASRKTINDGLFRCPARGLDARILR